ncbi:MAG: tRNA (adenosine(37)-N6)-dimethylallyltransferase MiaA [Candidatus Omnitrophica bacterium]|nr:tRNA (adenosine(37)-N6)-dimethylallyltransferase MiaA [Candidatus Omnitrophota bacterium]
MSQEKNSIVFIVGPTAVGKSEVAALLAKKINAEIISCDSMQIYKGMDIITSKPSPALIKQVPHHLIGIVAPTSRYDVSKYRKDALKKINELVKQGKTPLFVGGTGLYMTILLDGIFQAKAEDKVLRSRLYQLAKQRGGLYLYKQLAKVDPIAAKKIHPNDTKRIIRAIEVYKITGKPISQLQTQRKGLTDDYDIRIFCLHMEREALYKRIDARVERMFKQGVVKEASKLLKLRLSKTAKFAIGLRELKGYFWGAYDLEEAKEMMKQNTRQYAKRQLTWFRKDKRIQWIEVRGNEKSVTLANRIFKLLKKGQSPLITGKLKTGTVPVI